MSFLPDVTVTQLVLIVALAAFSAIAGGVSGYGTGALMPLVLVPMVGAAPVVPIIAISAMFSNAARVTAFRRLIDPRRALIALVVALPTCALGAWLYTLLSGRGAALVIGTTLIATVPLRRLLRRRGHELGEKGFVAGAAVWGLLMGGTTGSGVILLSLMMAAGLEGAAVIATDAAVSVVTGVAKVGVVRPRRRADPAGHRDRLPDRRGGVSLHLPRQAHRRASAGACAHGAARRGRHRRRRGDDRRRVPLTRRCVCSAALGAALLFALVVLVVVMFILVVFVLILGVLFGFVLALRSIRSW